MYILMLVSTIIMLLALMTYGRLESFRGFAFLQSEFEVYMEIKERKYPNEQAVKIYKESVATKQEESEKTEQERNPASSRLSFYYFVNSSKTEDETKESDQLVQMAKDLMTFLYSDQDFYKKIEEKRLNFLDEILTHLKEATSTHPIGTKRKEIATVDLGDMELNEVFTLMLKGTIDKKEKLMNAEQIQIVGDETPTVLRSFKPVNGYYSLLDFITLEKNKSKIRVFLASPQLLMVLFGSPSVVQDILEKRYELYRDLVNENTNQESGSAEFKDDFLDQRLPYVDEEMLDFGISKTNPHLYD